MNFLRRTSERPASRGQGLVEFAIVLPLMLLIVMMAIDFGRVFFGWVGLQNVARIGAIQGALYPTTDWSDDSDERVVEYVDQLNADAAAINCEDLSPDPDVDLDFPEGTTLGSPVIITLTCDFHMITPLMSNLMGNPLELEATAVFPIRSGVVGGSGGGGGGGGGGGEETERTVPDLVGMSLRDARLAWATAGFLGDFTPSSGQNSRLVTAPQNPVPGTPMTPTTTITVVSEIAPTCSGTDRLLPKVEGLTVADARASWASAGFTAANFDPETGSSDQVVTAQTADPAATWATCVPNTTELSVEFEAPQSALCLVPDLIGKQSSQAQDVWTAADFTTAVQFNGATPFKIGRQDIVQNVIAYCETTVITVSP